MLNVKFAFGAKHLVWKSSHQAVPHRLHSYITKNHFHPVNQLRVRWKWYVGSISHWSTNQAKAYMQVWVFLCKMFGHFTCLRSRNGHFNRRGNLSLSCWMYELVIVWKQNACNLFLKVVAQSFCSRLCLIMVLQMATSVSTEFVLS